MKKFLLILLAAASVAIVSCSKDEGTADNPTTITLAKHWFVRVQGPVTTSNYSLFSTRTLYITEIKDTATRVQVTRQSLDTITVDDHNLLNPTLRSNIRIDVASRTFGAGQYKNWNNTADSVIVKEGKIIRDGGRSKSGRTVDSIYLKYAFKSAPATDYILKGHERTGFTEDEY
jgi:hypothetical protein